MWGGGEGEFFMNCLVTTIVRCHLGKINDNKYHDKVHGMFDISCTATHS